MRAARWVFSAALLTLVPASGVAQVTPIGAGQTIMGRLESNDLQLDDDSYYDVYEYRGRPGEAIVVTMRSSDFDAYLSGGAPAGNDLTEEDSDDDGAGGTDARLSVTIGSSGVYRVRANSFDGGATGSYTLTVESPNAGGGGGILSGGGGGGILSGGGGGGAAPAGPGGGILSGGGTNVLTPGQTVSGRLEPSDPQLSDESYYDLYEYRGRPGEEIVVTMRSSDFDAYLSGGPPSGADVDAEDRDDDGGGGTDALLRVTVGSSGVYRVRANSLGGGQTGAYTLSLQSGDASAGAGSNVVVAGQTVSGRLEGSDPQLSDDSYFDTYYYDGSPGERLLVTMTSSDFDTFLRWGQGEGAAFELAQSDDDGAGNTNSQLEVELTQSGRYVIQANSYGGGETGGYALSVERLGSGAGASPTIALGQTITGTLDASDPVLSDDSPYELYVYRGQAGEQLLVTMRSSDFDTYLQAGRLLGERFEADVSDDDGGGGTDSQLLATVPAGGSIAIVANTFSASGVGRFSLTVEPLSGTGGASPPAPAVPPDQPTVGAGMTVNGTLSADDGMLADSSFYDQVVYTGSPGDRLRITMSSSDFDAYLGWGRLEAGTFTGIVYDDDGGGGSDAQLEVTVDGTGVFAAMANSYAAGQTGAYTLSVERLDAAAAPAAPVAGEAGKWLYEYVEPPSSAHRALGQRVKRHGALEAIASTLSQRYALPRPVGLRFDTCDAVNAFYSPSETEIVFCYELLELLANIFVPDGQWTEEQNANVFGAVEFITMHEVGHALVDVLDLPITGREEDVADQLAVYVLARDGEKGAQAALAGVSALQPSSNEFDATQLADEHSLGPVRLYNVMCWIYGSDPNKYGGIVSSGSLPEDRAVRCPGEWDRMAKAWQRLLADHRP